jgi:2-dehydropantoate 2-reductase
VRALRIAVVGCGAMGSVYAGRLAAEGNAVYVADPWPDHIAAIAAHGLRVDGPRGDAVVRVATDRTSIDAPFDLVVIAAKSLDIAAAAQTAHALAGRETVVLTIQNGLGAAEIVANIIGEQRLAIGIAGGFGAKLAAPGHVVHNAMQLVRFGPYGSLPIDRLTTIASAWSAAGFNVEVRADIARIQWEKLICNVAFSGPCVIAGTTVGDVMDDPNLGPISRSAAIEAYDVARALGIGLGIDDPIAHVRAFGESVRAAKPSTLIDIERGRPSEIDFINGAVAREAERIGVRAPINTTITAFVKRLEHDRVHRGAHAAEFTTLLS